MGYRNGVKAASFLLLFTFMSGVFCACGRQGSSGALLEDESSNGRSTSRGRTTGGSTTTGGGSGLAGGAGKPAVAAPSACAQKQDAIGPVLTVCGPLLVDDWESIGASCQNAYRNLSRNVNNCGAIASAASSFISACSPLLSQATTACKNAVNAAKR